MARLHRAGRVHQHPGLAVAALGHLVADPGLLRRMAAVLGQALDGDDPLSGRRRDVDVARLLGLAVHHHRARAADFDAAAVLGAGEVEHVAQHPQQGHVGSRDIDRAVDAVDVEGVAGHGNSCCSV
jgi:hypothetical protein